jgi:hypothetical protein
MYQPLRVIIEAGTRAPSGDNCQPWRFQAGKDCIDLFNVPDRDTSLYNYRQRASLIALGACLENMLIAAAHLGLSAHLSFFPEPGDGQHVARVTLSRGGELSDPLYPFIAQRTTNRKKFDCGTLSSEQALALEAAAREVPGATLLLHQGAQKISEAADLAACSDRLVFENPLLHAFLFDHLRWTSEQAEGSRDGMDILTLELAPHNKIIFPLLKHYNLARLVRGFGATRLIAANARRLMLSASAAGLIYIANSSDASWLDAGRLMERVWLEATRLGLSFHLMTGITLLLQKVREGDVAGLSSRNLALLQQAEALLQRLNGAAADTTALLFRVGFCGPPSARSLRRAVSFGQ